MEKFQRALDQRIYLLSAKHESSDIWEFSLRGESNKIYTQTLTPNSYKCSCPNHFIKKAFCKHLLFLISRVANQTEIAVIVCEHKDRWNTELFNICNDLWIRRLVSHCNKDTNVTEKKEIDPGLDSTCSVCFEDMTKEDTLSQCVKTCKNYFHNNCIQMWLNTGHETCPLCRAKWSDNNLEHDTEIEDGISSKIKVNITSSISSESIISPLNNNVNVNNVNNVNMKTDIVLSIDVTPSLFPGIILLKKNMENIVDQYFNTITRLRIAIITHNEKLDFTSNKDSILNFINNITLDKLDDDVKCTYHILLKNILEMPWGITNTNKSVIMIGDCVRHYIGYSPNDSDISKFKNRNIKVYALMGLYFGNRFSYQFYQPLASDNGYLLFLDQLTMINDMIKAIGIKHQTYDNVSETSRQLENVRTEMECKYGSQNITVKLFFDTLMDKINQDDIYKERAPCYFNTKYKYTKYLERINTTKYDFKNPDSPEDNDGIESYSYHEKNRKTAEKDITLMKYQILDVDRSCWIKEFYQDYNLQFRPGGIFYELVISEKIPDGRDIVVVNNTTGEMYEGKEARKMVSNSLTIVEEFTGKGVTVDPKAFPNFRIFIETNGRKILTPNKGFMYRVIANIKVTGYHVK